MAERKIRPFDDAARVKLAADDLIEKLASRELEQPGAGVEHTDFGGACLFEQGDLAFRPDQRDGRFLGPQRATG